MKLFQLKLLLALIVLPALLAAQSQQETDLEEFIADFEGSLGFSGAVLVAGPEGVIYEDGLGLANRTWGIPNSGSTRFLIASLTKPMTAALVLKLMDSGQISLDDTLDDLLPEYPADYSARVTVSQLLKHTSGIPNFSRIPGWFDGQYLNSIPPADFAAVVAELPLEFEPGTDRIYSNSNYLLLGLIIQSITGQPYADFLEDSIFKPADMNDSGLVGRNTEVIPSLAANYIGEGSGYRKGGYVNYEHFIASGSVYSTVGDLYKWTQALLGGEILSEAALSTMLDPDDSIAWDVSRIQLSENLNSIVIVGDGELEGYEGMIMMIPDTELTVVLLNNTGFGYDGLLNLSRRIFGYLRNSR